MTRKNRLPSFLKPIYETDLIRVGNKKDGGYLIPSKSLKKTKILYSFGLETDWSFEEDFFKLTNSKIFCYDHTTDWKLLLKLFLKKPNKFFLYFQYKKFFDNRKKFHIKKMIYPTNSFNPAIKNDLFADLNSILLDVTKAKNIFLKIDIEGSEYRILDQIINYSFSLNTLVIEFHDCDLHMKKIKNFINDFELDLVHIHVNNWSTLNSSNIPGSIELTFSTKEFNQKNNDDNKIFPIDIDMPCNELYQDLPIEFYD